VSGSAYDPDLFSGTLVCGRLNTYVSLPYTHIHTDACNSFEVVGTAGLRAFHLNSCRNKQAVIIKGGMRLGNVLMARGRVQNIIDVHSKGGQGGMNRPFMCNNGL